MSQPSMGQVHQLEQELSRRYEVSKEIELSILGPVPSILESGKMAATSSEIDQNLKQVSECYTQRCQLRHGLRDRLNLLPDKPVPVMTFDQYHNLVPKQQPVGGSQGEVSAPTASANKIKLDNMEIEVSNEIMAMIYYRALMGKFERQGLGRGGPGHDSQAVPHSAAGPGKREVTSEASGGLGVRYDVEEEDNEELLDSASETDVSKLDLSSLSTREMRLRSLQRYSPRLKATMLPVLETEDERWELCIPTFF